MDNKSYLRMCLMVDKETVTLERGLIRALVEMAKDRGSIPSHHYEVIDHVRTRIGDVERESHVSFLSSFLCNGDSKISLTEHHQAMALCDGYGKLTITELGEKGLLHDWSHVRDSSVEALRNVRSFIETAILMDRKS